MRNYFITTVLTLILSVLSLISARVQAADDNKLWLFTSFRGNGDGLHLSWSKDALNWQDIPMNLLTPEVGSGLMRDSHLFYGPDGVFRLVWTTGWNDKGIGYASSKDLVSWSAQKYIPVFEDRPASNCWAPETVYDADAGLYMIIWSSEVKDQFPETVSPDRMNNRAYYITTKDFESFSKPHLLFDPGFDNIDSTIVKDGNRYILTLKEGDKQSKNIWGPIHQAVSDKLTGPYKLLDKPVLTDRAEGLALVQVEGKWTLYFDYYANGHYGARQTTDFVNWTDVSDKLHTVDGQRHGTVLQVPATVVEKLLADVARIKAESEIMPPACVLPGYHADPHIAVFGDTYYIYPTTDGNDGWNTNSFSCMSSKDLIHWQNHGVILQLGKDITWTDKNAWAPAIAVSNGKYYFYFSAFSNVGVAVSDTPYGPFKDALGKPLVERGSYNCQVIDPMVFVDDDGSAYLYFGQGNCNVVKLNADMVSYDPAAVKTITPVDADGKKSYNEGTFMIKRQGKYYLMWSEFDARDPRYSVCYAVADSPIGPFVRATDNPVLKAKGLVLGAGHHSVVQKLGTDNWYIVYHRFAIPNGTGYKRETCISPMYFNADGSIKPVNVYEGVK